MKLYLQYRRQRHTFDTNMCVCVLACLYLYVKELIFQTVRKYPNLVQPVIKKLLPRLRKGPTTKLMEKHHLTNLVRTELTVPQVIDHTVEETVDFLHASGEVHSSLGMEIFLYTIDLVCRLFSSMTWLS